MVNPHAAWVKDGDIIEDLTDLGLSYVDGSFTPASSNSVILTLDTATPKMLVVKLPDDNNPATTDDELGTSSASFQFKTTVDNKDDYAYNTITGRDYTNTAEFSGHVRENRVSTGDAQEAESSSTAKQKVVSEVLAKRGEYDYRDNRITWTMTLNQNAMPMEDVALKDTIPAGQAFVEGSVRLNGGSTGFTANHENGVLEIALTGAVNTQQTVIYKTEVDPDLISAFRTESSITLSNAIVLERGGGFTDLPLSANVKVNNQLMKKTAPAQGSNDYIEFTIDINPHGITLDGIALKDVLPEGLALDVGSVRLYEANVNKNGVLSATASYLTADGLGLSLDPEENSFTFKLPDGKGKYRLAYGCDIVDRSKAPFDNSASLSGGDVGGSTSSGSVSVGAGGGGGGGTGIDSRKAQINITKEESIRPGLDMSGIRFGLFQTIGGREQCVLEETTDTDGKLTFYPLALNQAYTIRELDVREGYSPVVVTSSGNIALESFTVTPTKPKSLETLDMLIQNVPATADVGFTNINDWGRRLGGCDFRLVDLTVGSSIDTTCTSDQNGNVSFGSMPMGRYRLSQTTASIPGHTPNRAPHIVDIKADGSYSIYPEAGGEPLTGQLVNEVNKVDVSINVFAEDTGSPLEGVLFNAVDSNGKIVGQGYSDKNGDVLFGKLAVGEDYTIIEAKNKEYMPSPNQLISIPLNASSQVGEPFLRIEWPKTRKQYMESSRPDVPDNPNRSDTPDDPDIPDIPDSSGNATPDQPDIRDNGSSAPKDTIDPIDDSVIDQKDSNPKTGDTSNPSGWIAILALSAFQALFLVRKFFKQYMRQ